MEREKMTGEQQKEENDQGCQAMEFWANRVNLVSAQVSEMQLVREKVYAMEQTHMTLKQK